MQSDLINLPALNYLLPLLPVVFSAIQYFVSMFPCCIFGYVYPLYLRILVDILQCYLVNSLPYIHLEFVSAFLLQIPEICFLIIHCEFLHHIRYTNIGIFVYLFPNLCFPSRFVELHWFEHVNFHMTACCLELPCVFNCLASCCHVALC